MQNYNIPRTEILKLYESSLNEVSAHSIGQWLKSKTDKQYIVVPMEIMKIIFGASWDASNATEKISSSMEELKDTWL